MFLHSQFQRGVSHHIDKIKSIYMFSHTAQTFQVTLQKCIDERVVHSSHVIEV